MISTGSIKVQKKRKYNGHFCSVPGCSNSYWKTNVQELKEVIILSQWRTGKDYRRGWKIYFEISGHQPYILRYVEIILLKVCMAVILKHSFCSTLRSINSVSLISCISNWFKPNNMYPTEFIISDIVLSGKETNAQGSFGYILTIFTEGRVCRYYVWVNTLYLFHLFLSDLYI